jgi:hypothetical protein
MVGVTSEVAYEAGTWIHWHCSTFAEEALLSVEHQLDVPIRQELASPKVASGGSPL